MTHIDAMKQWLKALEKCEAALAEELGAWDIDPPLHHVQESYDLCGPAITSLRKAIAEAEQEPVAWLITDEKINHLQVESIQRLIDRARHAHHTDICLRINGKDEWFQADWLKHMTRTSPPQRKPLTDEEIAKIASTPCAVVGSYVHTFARAIEAAHGIKENT